jgi:hypothetical protein
MSKCHVPRVMITTAPDLHPHLVCIGHSANPAVRVVNVVKNGKEIYMKVILLLNCEIFM